MSPRQASASGRVGLGNNFSSIVMAFNIPYPWLLEKFKRRVLFSILTPLSATHACNECFQKLSSLC